jgi:hypothetical protein
MACIISIVFHVLDNRACPQSFDSMMGKAEHVCNPEESFGRKKLNLKIFAFSSKI